MELGEQTDARQKPTGSEISVVRESILYLKSLSFPAINRRTYRYVHNNYMAKARNYLIERRKNRVCGFLFEQTSKKQLPVNAHYECDVIP